MHDIREQSAQDVAEILREELRGLARIGSATPSDLVFAAPRLIDIARGGRPQNVEEAVEELHEAIRSLPDRDRQAVEIIFGLSPGSRGEKLGTRREQAGERLGVQGGTFRTHHEPRLLDAVAQILALRLADDPGISPADDFTVTHEPVGGNRVLILHGSESIALPEVRRFLTSLGLEPMGWNEALELIGLSSPTLIDNLQSCLDVVQAVVILLEDQGNRARENLLFEAGLALGLASSRTVIVEVGSWEVPSSLSAVRILSLRNSAESRRGLRSAMQMAGCTLAPEKAQLASDARSVDLATGWYRWTPAIAEMPAHVELAEAVIDFRSEGAYGAAAAKWLRDDALPMNPEVVTYFLFRDGRIEGFFALASTSVLVSPATADEGIIEATAGEAKGASILKWLACHRDASEAVEEGLLLRALKVSTEVSEMQGAVGLLVEPFDAKDAERWIEKYQFRTARNGETLWHALPPPGDDR